MDDVQQAASGHDFGQLLRGVAECADVFSGVGEEAVLHHVAQLLGEVALVAHHQNLPGREAVAVDAEGVQDFAEGVQRIGPSHVVYQHGMVEEPRHPPGGGGFWFNVAQHAGQYMDKLKTTASIFELPKRLGIIQYIEYELPLRDRCPDGEKCEGVLVAEGCRRGVCIKYRVVVHSTDRRNWVIEGFRRVRVADGGGCISQAVADALWELAGHYDVGVWYEYRWSCSGIFGMCTRILERRECGPVINGVRLSQPYCSSLGKCAERILEEYKRQVEAMKDPPLISSNAADELLRRYPELEAFGAEWVRAWAPHAKERLAEIAEVVRKFPWMVEVVKKRPVGNPYAVEAYAAVDGSEVCLFLAPLRAYCARNGSVKAVPLELQCDKEEKKKKVCRPKGLLVFAAASEYVKIL